MTTLEMVRLRTPLPTGRITLRFPSPLLDPSLAELAAVEGPGVPAPSPAPEHETTTTPQVAQTPDGAGETAAGKGREAR